MKIALYSFFKSLFTVLFFFVSAAAWGQATDLFISEYVEGSSNNKYIEIYNGTGSTVNLEDYRLRLYANGSASTANDIQLSGSLANGGVIVYKNSAANLILPAGVTAIDNDAVNFNGDDALALFKISTNSNVDIFGRIGNDPGAAWTATGYTTVDKTLRRKVSVCGGIKVNPTGTGAGAFTTLSTEWDVFNIDTVNGLGSHTANCVASNIITTEDLDFTAGTCITASGLPVDILFGTSGSFGGTNVFTAQLSDAAGSFASPVNIGTLNQSGVSGNTGLITANIPAGIPPGTGYRIRVISSNPAVTGSDNGTDLTLRQSVVITSQPNVNARTYCQGAVNPAVLSVTATGSDLTYQWYRVSDNSAVAGATSASFTPPTNTAGTERYYCIVSNSCGIVQSNNSGVYTINAAPPAPSGTISHTTPCESSVLTYTPGPGDDTVANTYYWVTTASSTSTANNAANPLTVSGTGAKAYFVRAYNGLCWSSPTAVYNFTISAAPVITTQPADANVTAGTSATFSVGGVSSSGITKQWQVSTDNGGTWTNIGTGTVSLSITGTTVAMNGNLYRCVVSNSSCPAVISNHATLYVNHLKPNNITNLKGCIANDQITLNWTAPSSGTAPTGYMVFVKEGSVSPIYTSPPFPPDAVSFSVNSNFALATEYATLGKAVYRGNTTSATVTGLTKGNQYTLKVVAYNSDMQTGWASAFTGSVAAATGSYTIGVPEINSLTASKNVDRSTVDWNVVPSSVGCYEYLVVANQGTVVFTPSGDGSAYIPNTVYSGANQVVYNGTGGSVIVTGLTEGLEYCYKVFVREVNRNQWSEGVAVCQTPELTYCASQGSTTDATGITGVDFNTIIQTSTGAAAYSDYTTISTDLNLGESYSLSVRVNTAGNFTTYAKAWIDWNRNGSFNDSGEEYNLGTAVNVTDAYTAYSPITVTVPINASTGSVRMRISNKYNGNPTSCENFSYGEVEDYTLNILATPEAEIIIKGNNIPIPSGGNNVPVPLNNTLFAETEINTDALLEKEFVIENVGLSNLLLTGNPVIQLTGENPGDFEVTQQPTSTTLANKAITAFRIKFHPTTAAVLTAIVSVANNDTTGDENPYTFKIEGKGKCTVSPVVSMSPATGPGSTIVRFTSSVNSLVGAVATLNGTALTVISASATLLEVQIPADANSGTISLKLATGCVFTQEFKVVKNENTGCAGAMANPPTDLIFYEIYDENGGSGGFVSIYNGTSSAKNLADYEIYRDGGNGPIPYTNNTLKGIINPGELKVLKVSLVNKCTLPASTGNGSIFSGFNENDVFQLRSKDGALIYDIVNTPNYVGYYMKRALGQLANSPSVYNPSYWSTNPVGSTDCLASGEPPVVPAILPVINDQPVFAPDCSNIVLSVTATEGVTDVIGLTYQWYSLEPGAATWQAVADNGTYSGATTNTLSISSAAGLHDYQYYVQVRENTVTCYTASNAVQIKDPETRWDGNEWSRGFPQLWSKVVIEADYNTQTHGALDICELTVNSGNFVIEKDFPVKVQNKVSNNATETNFTIENDGQLLQVDDVENTGRITVKRNMSFTDDRKEYNYLASPVEGQHMKMLFGAASNTPYVLVLKESTNLFVNAAAADYTIIGKGFAVKEAIDTYTDSVAHFKGKPVNGSHPVTVTKTSEGRGWNLIGNPYSSNLDLKLYYEQNDANMLPEFRFWDNRVNNTYVQYGGAYNGYSYAIYNALSDEGNPAPGGDAGNNTGTPGTPTEVAGLYRYAKVSQGFLIRAVNLGDHDLNFRNTQRTVNQPDRGFFGKNEVLKDRYRLQLISPSDLHLTNTVVYFEGGSNSFGLEDSRHPSSGASDAFYSLAGTDKTVINGRAAFEDTDVIALGNKHYVSGNYTIRAIDRIGVFANGQSIYLKDKALNIITDLTAGDYAFTTEAGDFTNRFEIVYKPAVVLAADDASRTLAEVYRDGSDFVVRADRTVETVEVFDASGRLLITVNGSARELRFGASPLTDGIYVVKARLKGGDTFTKKIRK